MVSIWGENMLGYLSADGQISVPQSSQFLPQRLTQTVSFEERIISADKYTSIFSPQIIGGFCDYSS